MIFYWQSGLVSWTQFSSRPMLGFDIFSLKYGATFQLPPAGFGRQAQPLKCEAFFEQVAAASANRAKRGAQRALRLPGPGRPVQLHKGGQGSVANRPTVGGGVIGAKPLKTPSGVENSSVGNAC